MKPSPLHKLQQFGQSVWLDGLSPQMIASGALEQLIREDGVSGVVASSVALGKPPQSHMAGENPAAWRQLSLRDIADAADLLWPVYEETHATNGFVSMEVSPHLAHDTEAMLDEARELWHAVYRPNVMIGVPGTRAGLPVIRRLIADGISVNVTMLFGADRYREAFDACCDGLEDRLAAGMFIEEIASVASFPLSLIDTHIDAMLEAVAQEHPAEAACLAGKAAIASARVIYQDFRMMAANRRWKRLTALGAQVQRPLWVSSHPGSPMETTYQYIEPLIGLDTVCAMSPEMLAAYRDNGQPTQTLRKGFPEAETIMADLAKLLIDHETMAQNREIEAIATSLAAVDGARSETTGYCAALPRTRSTAATTIHLDSTAF